MAWRLLAFFFLITGAFFWQTPAYADHSTIATAAGWQQFDQGKVDQAINSLSPINRLPNNSFYFVITLKENLTRFFKSTPVERALFDIVLAGKRLKESYLLAKNNNYRQAQDNLRRYDAKVVDVFEQFEKIEKQNLPKFQALENLATNLIYQRTIFAALIQDGNHKDENFNQNLNHSTQEFVSLVKFTIKALPAREHELRELLPKN